MNTAEILNKAADVIEERGWHKGDFVSSVGFDGSGCVCVLGAINVAVGEVPYAVFEIGDRDERTDAARVLAEYLGLVLRDGDVTEVGDRWNDAEGRTKDEVVAALREAARKAGAS